MQSSTLASILPPHRAASPHHTRPGSLHMATLTVHPSPHALHNMPSNRMPLRDAPSAVLNSPLRQASTAIIGHKRPRPEAHDHRDVQRPAVQRSNNENRYAELTKRSTKQTDLQRKLEASRRTTRPATERQIHQQDDYAQWQHHYRRLFPTLKFYFEGLPKDVCNKLVTQVRSLGADHMMFFSKDVTHVITMRQIPTDNTSSSSMQSPPRDGNTINPSLLENNQRAKFTFEPPLGKKQPPADILYKAREMNMKIWTVEKLQRMLVALFAAGPGQYTDSKSNARSRISKEAELSQLLKNEKKQTTTDRDWMSEMLPFRGCYVYVYDMDERTKPTMIRDYPRAEKKEMGKWPQLRVSTKGRCPFVDDPPSKRGATLEATRVTDQVKPRTRAATADEGRRHPPLRDLINPPQQDIRRPLDPPRGIPIKRGSTDQLPLYGSAQAHMRVAPRMVQGEPVASGVQPSNITSALKSQMISSTAAVPGAKAGNSRTFNMLKRKVLDPDRDTTSTEGRMSSLRAALNEEPARPAKRKAPLGEIAEEQEPPARPAPRKKRVVEKECKPGYCENCREKFDDFDEHIISKTHRKFAHEATNFAELDNLLRKLGRV